MTPMIENKSQSSAQNIQQEIDTRGIIVYGKQGAGKTLTAICLALDWYPRIYANFEIYQNGKMINHYLPSVDAVKKVRFSYTPGVIVIDEAGINANSKDTRSRENRELQEILFLVRKLNCSLIWISQRFESIDVNARVLSELIIEMRKIRRGFGKYPLFIATKQKQIKSNLNFINQYKIDCIGILKSYGITYNTLENSKFTKKKSEFKQPSNLVT